MSSGVPWNETRRRLLNWALGQTPSERLAGQVLDDEGFLDIDPSHPMGGRDGGADALAGRDGLRWTMAAFFPQGQQKFNDIKKKVVDDYAGVAKNGADGMAFVTNQAVTRGERDKLQKAVAGPLMLYHLERMVTILDRPRMYGVRYEHLNIEAPTGLDRAARVGELWRASRSRCQARWQSLGIPEALARQLADDRTVGAIPTGLHPTTAGSVIVWTGPFGSGKSIAAERSHQDGLESAANAPDAPAPAFLRAEECVPDLQKSVEQAVAELGEPRRVGATVVIDGVDELGYQRAAVLLSQARVLTGTWPATSVLITSRPIVALTDAPEHRAFPTLDEAQQEACIAIGLGAEPSAGRLHGLAQPVKATMGQPFFALLAGVWMRERTEDPRAPIDLMSMLGEYASRATNADESQLRRLACLSLGRDFAPVAAGDVLEGAPIDDLLVSGMVEPRGAGLAFVLPAVAQWFAAQALLLDEIKVDELLDVPEDLEVWRYPFAMAISLGSFDQAQRLLSPLIEGAPGFAFRVLDATFGQAIHGGAPVPRWREGGGGLRQVLQPLADSIQPVAQLVCDVDAEGRLRPMGVASGPDHLNVAFWRGSESKPDVFPLPPGVGPFALTPEWSSARSSVVGPGASWAWNWARDTIKGRLAQQLGDNGLPVDPRGPFGRELAWVTACDVANASPLMTAELEIEHLSSLLDPGDWQPPEDVELGPRLIVEPGFRFHDSRALEAAIADADARGESVFRAPIPPGDQWSKGGGMIGELYSDARLIEAATAVYELAIAGYRQLVERWFPKLAPYLEHYALLPVRLHGILANRSGFGFGPIPSLGGYLEALPEGQESSVVMQMGDYDYNDGPRIYQRQIEMRPAAARWLTGRHGGLPLELSSRYPVTTVVQAWLGEDLALLGLRNSGRLGVPRHGLSLDM
jgi:hypothetical protein